jgi:predicted GNAT family N-acyltransferase
MATADGQRGRGVGRAVVLAAIGYVRGHGAPLLWCNAREGAAGFYARHGFRQHGDVFTDERHVIPHVRMWLDLTAESQRRGWNLGAGSGRPFR